MRLAFFCYRGNMMSGGQGLYLHALTQELARQGHEIDVLVGPPYPDPMPWANVVEIENHHFWASRFEKRRGAFLPKTNPFQIFEPLHFYEFLVTRFGFLPEPFAFSLRATTVLLDRLRRGVRYDLVHDIQSVGYGLLWVQALGIPVVTTIHHPLTVDLRSALVRARTFRERKGALTFYPVRSQARVARRLAGIVTSSEASRRQIESDFGVRPDRIHNVHNGVDLPTPGTLRPRPEQPELLFVGRCSDPNKGLEHLLDALARLPEPFVLRVLDRFPADTWLERRVNELGIGHRIRWEGKLPRTDLEAAFREATIVVLPSLFEGFGLPAVEALAAGTPVVCTTAGALAEVIRTAGVGALVPAADPSALAGAIADVWKRWEAEQAACVAARDRIERAFGWPEVAARTARVYEHVRASSTERRRKHRR